MDESNGTAYFTSDISNMTVTTKSSSVVIIHATSDMITVVTSIYIYMLIVTGVVGTVSNLSVLVAMIKFGEHRRTTTNVFICSQLVMDSVPCVATLIYCVDTVSSILRCALSCRHSC